MSTKNGYPKGSILRDIYDSMLGGLRAYYFNIGTNIYKWDGMPKEIPIRYPERTLYDNGLSVFLEVPSAGYACLPVMTGSIQNNMYGEPAEWKALAIGKYAGIVSSMKLNSSNSVLIRNDSSYKNCRTYVDSLIKQIINADITTRMNINAQKNPIWFKTTDENVIQNKNLFKEWYEGEPVFFKDSVPTEAFEFITPNVPFLGNQLADMYNVYDYRILSYLGIDNPGVDKKERMITSEADSRSDKISLIRESRLEQRKIASEQINELFGLNVSVDINDSLKEETQDMSTDDTENDDNKSDKDAE